MSDVIHELKERVTSLEERVENVAKREWVHELITPIRDSVMRIDSTFEGMTKDMRALFSTQDQLLKEKAARDEELHKAQLRQSEQQTLSYILKEKWTPFLIFVSLVISTCAAIIGGATWWIVNHVLPHVPVK